MTTKPRAGGGGEGEAGFARVTQSREKRKHRSCREGPRKSFIAEARQPLGHTSGGGGWGLYVANQLFLSQKGPTRGKRAASSSGGFRVTDKDRMMELGQVSVGGGGEDTGQVQRKAGAALCP